MSEGEQPHELIIVRRHEEEAHEHHSSAWKVAHADFMTAMMAFFLIMWLINVTDDQMRKGISQYFNPIHLSAGDTELKGLNKPGEAETKPGAKGGHSDKPASPAFNPMAMTQGAADAKALAEAKAETKAAAATVAASQAAAASQIAAAAPAGAGAATASGSAAGAVAAATVTDQAMVGGKAPGSMAGEEAAFQDPYAVLARLAADYVATHPASTAATAGDDRPVGAAGGDADRDPFDPAYWQLIAGQPARAAQAGPPNSLAALPPDAELDAAAPLTRPQAAKLAPLVEQPATVVSSIQLRPAAATPADAASQPPPTISPSAVGAESAPAEEAAGLKAELQKAMPELGSDTASPTLSVKASKEGLLIDLTDDANFSMFLVGSAVPDPKVVVLLAKIAQVLSERSGVVVVRGYTDARPFHSPAYDNWRLSAARAHMAFYMLVRGGLDEKRVASIEGFADRSPKNPGDPLAAENRRIEILLQEPK